MMSLSKAYDLLIVILCLVLSIVVTSSASPHIAKHGCSDRCGNVSIPFPFGIGANCAFNKWYVISCNSSKPYLSATALNRLEVLGIDLVIETVTVNAPTAVSDCQYPRPSGLNSSSSSTVQMKSVDLERSPFMFSGSWNKLVLEGCGNTVISSNGSLLTGCSTVCRNDSSTSSAVRRREKNNTHCLGITCCETRIPNLPPTSYDDQYDMQPNDLTSYTVELETDDVDRSGSSSCGSAFFVDEDLYVRGRFSNGVAPVTLRWYLTDLDFQQITCCDLSYDSHYGGGYLIKAHRANGTFVYVQRCYQKSELEGNAYLRDGCAVKEECASCRANGSGGYCYYDFNLNFTCFHYNNDPFDYPYPPSKKLSLGVILGMNLMSPVMKTVDVLKQVFKAFSLSLEILIQSWSWTS